MNRALVVSQLAITSSAWPKGLVGLRAASDSLIGPIAIPIVLVFILRFINGRWLRRLGFANGNHSFGFSEAEFPPCQRIHHRRGTLRSFVPIVVIRCDRDFVVEDAALPVAFRDATFVVI